LHPAGGIAMMPHGVTKNAPTKYGETINNDSTSADGAAAAPGSCRWGGRLTGNSLRTFSAIM
jgi:hypothetical protein